MLNGGCCSMNPADDDVAIIERFLDALWLERGLSENTLAAYRRDLQTVESWLVERHKTLMDASPVDLHNFMAERLGPQQASSRSAARWLSAVRGFYRYQLLQRRLHEDPSADLAHPKMR